MLWELGYGSAKQIKRGKPHSVITSFRRELFQSRYLWALCFAVMALAFWQALASFIPTADNENLPQDIIRVTLGQGRVFSYLLLQFLAPTLNIHPLDLLIALLAFSLAIVVSIKTWSGALRRESYVGAIIAAAFPTTVHMFTFSTVNMLFGIAALAASLAVLCYVKGYRVLFCLLTIASVGMYQGILLNCLVSYLIFLIVQTTSEDSDIKALVKDAAIFLALLILSSLLYSVSIWILFSVLDIELLEIHEILRPDLLLMSAVKGAVFFYDILSGKAPLFLERGGIIGGFQVALVLLALANCLRLCTTNSKRLFCLVLLVAGVGAPFLSIALTGGVVKYRMMLGAPIAIGGLAYVATMQQPRLLQNAIVTASVLAAFFYLQATTQMLRGAALSWQTDRELTTRILERIAMINPVLKPGQKMPFDMVGTYNRPTPWIPQFGASTAVGYSFYRYSEIPSRVVGILSIMGYPNFRMATNPERLQIADRVAQMPVWPAPGSVAVIDGVAVVKFLKTYSAYQVASYCRSLPKEQCADILSPSP